MSERLGLLRRIRPRGGQIRPASEVNATYLFDRKRLDLAQAAFHEPLESVKDADHVATAEDTSDRDRTDHAVDAGSRSAPD